MMKKMKKKKSDTTLKIFAIVISLVLWSFVMREVNPDIEREYKNTVEITNTEALEKTGLRIMNMSEETVNVTIVGKKTDWANFSAENDVKAYVDLSGYSEGERKVPVKVDLTQLSNMKIVDFSPKEILFNFDKIITKDKAVTIRTSGELASGHVLGEAQTKLPTVILKGPRAWVNEVSEVVGEVNVEGRKEDINITVPLRVIDGSGNSVMGVTNEPSVIEVTIPVYKTVKLPIEIQTMNQLPENYETIDIDIKPLSVDLIGKNGIDDLKFIQTKPIDINLFIENKTIETELELPEGVKLLNPEEKITVTLNVEETRKKTFEYNIDELEIKNLSDDLALDSQQETQTIKITIKGSKQDIEAITKEDLELYLDLNMIELGESEIYIGFNIPSGITVDSVDPQPILLKIINKG